MRTPTILIASILLGGVACGPEPSEVDRTPEVADVADEPRQYAAEPLTVVGRVEQVLSDCALELTSGEGWLSAGPVYTVCSTQPPFVDRVEGPAPAEGDLVRIVGKSADMTRVSYERQTTATVDSDNWEEDETMAVLIAESIEMVERAQD